MKNYALEWKKKSRFVQVPYEDFIVEQRSVKGTFIEKVDGMLGSLVYDGTDAFFQTTTGKEMRDLPVISEYLAVFKKFKVRNAIIMGELVAKKNGTILPFNATQSVVKTSYKDSHKNLVYHYPFDIVEWNGQKVNFNQANDFIRKNFTGLQYVCLPKMLSGNARVFRKMYMDLKNTVGFDGIIVRTDDGKIYKVKFTDTADVVVMGAGAEGLPAWNKKQVSYLRTAFIDSKGILRSSSKIGSGFTASRRSQLYRYIQENKWYQKNGEIFVRPKLIVEIKFFRYRITPTPAYKMGEEYQMIGNMKSITFSHPTFVRIRSDKSPNRFDTRLQQIPEFEE